MGRFFVVLLATLFTMGMFLLIPIVRTSSFHVEGYGIPISLLIGGVFFCGYYRLTGK